MLALLVVGGLLVGLGRAGGNGKPPMGTLENTQTAVSAILPAGTSTTELSGMTSLVDLTHTIDFKEAMVPVIILPTETPCATLPDSFNPSLTPFPTQTPYSLSGSWQVNLKVNRISNSVDCKIYNVNSINFTINLQKNGTNTSGEIVSSDGMLSTRLNSFWQKNNQFEGVFVYSNPGHYCNGVATTINATMNPDGKSFSGTYVEPLNIKACCTYHGNILGTLK